MRFLSVLFLSLCCAASNAQVLSKSPLDLELRQSSILSKSPIANYPIVFWVLPFARVPVTSTAADPGYTPNARVPLDWLNPNELVWNFGDGTKRTSRRGMSATHQYKSPGTYTVRVTAKHSDAQFSTGTLSITVKDSDYLAMTVGAVAASLDAQSVQFTAASFARPQLADAALHYEWDFGDGKKRAGHELWNPVHRYAEPGQYKVLLTTTDASGIKDTAKKKVRIAGAADQTATAPSPEHPDAKTDPDTVLSEFTAEISGNATGKLRGAVRPITKTPYYLVGKGNSCRLKLSFWDDASLASGYITFRLVSPPAGGARYKAAKPQIALTLYEKAKEYRLARNIIIGKGGSVGSSPFGLAEKTTFRSRTGSAELEVVPGQYVLGKLTAMLREYKRTSKGQVPTSKSVKFNGQFSIKLGSLQDIPGIDQLQSLLSQQPVLDALKKIRRGSPCASEFDIKKFSPTKDAGQVRTYRPIIRTYLTQPIDPSSVSKQTFQVGYPDVNGKFVSTAGRYLVDAKQIRFVPDKPLKRGVHYQIRVKSGSDGVKSNTGSELADTDGTGWRSEMFTTTVDVQIRNNGSLGCNIYQSAQDVPLIAGKPAIARVHLRWPHLEGVHTNAQVKKFKARVTVGNKQSGPFGVKTHTFVRPDLFEKHSVNLRQGQDTAQVPFTPVENWKTDRLAVWIDAMPQAPKGNNVDYLSYCQYETWDKAPEISIRMYMLDLNEFLPVEQQISLGMVQRLAREVKEYAWQLLPVRRIKMTVGVIARPEPAPPVPYTQIPSGPHTLNAGWVNAGKMFPGYGKLLGTKTHADIHIVVAPHHLLGGGGNAYSKKYNPDISGYGVIVTSVSKKYFDRNVFAAVHEIGHTLSLEHTPFSSSDSITTQISAIRDAATKSGRPVMFDGIEGFRMSRSGKKSKLKSSKTGNSEAQWLGPLMFPSTFKQHRAFITNLNYRCAQEYLSNVKIRACPQRSAKTGKFLF